MDRLEAELNKEDRKRDLRIEALRAASQVMAENIDVPNHKVGSAAIIFLANRLARWLETGER